MLNQKMVDLLSCPSCRQSGLVPHCSAIEDQFVEGHLACETCDAKFEVHDGIPYFNSMDFQEGEDWNTWTDHLKGFQARREIRQSQPSAKRTTRWSKKLQAFVDFVDAPAGNMLDVGCGPGNLRKYLDPNKITYYGIDPIPVPETKDFPFACGLAESLPFQDNTFSSVVVRSALDHFCDLEAFFDETSRILTADGRIYLEQVTHGNGGVVDFAKNAVHAVKDFIDDMKTRQQRNDSPKHMREFSKSSLMEAVKDKYSVQRIESYTSNWYTPTQIFICLEPLQVPVAMNA